MNRFVAQIISENPAIRDTPSLEVAMSMPTAELLVELAGLEAFRQNCLNLYHRVRAAIILHGVCRFRLQEDRTLCGEGLLDKDAFFALFERQFEKAIARIPIGPNLTRAGASLLAQAYEQGAYQDLADQVRQSVRQLGGNRWMYRLGAAAEHPLRITPVLLERDQATGLFPLLCEKTPVRLDLTHSCWSDIFFLGMDFPEGAKVVNISVDLGVHGRDSSPVAPITTWLRVIPEPLLRLTSIDLGDTKDVQTLTELFNFGNDHLGLVKAAVVASGLIPSSVEGTDLSLAEILGRIVRPGFGIEISSRVGGIPKGSRLAVSTNLLASLISLLMRASGQTASVVGGLLTDEAKLVVARAILGEWLGGSGGGWQDSGGVFPGIKRIEGQIATEEDPEWGISRGRLLPKHTILHQEDPVFDTDLFAERLSQSLIPMHGGMAQNVGPILNMVTTHHLLRSGPQWSARKESLSLYGQILEAVRFADIRKLAGLTDRHWNGPLATIIPWVTNAFTEAVIQKAKSTFARDYWGFQMLGGMSGGGMGIYVDPSRHARARDELWEILVKTKRHMEDTLPFAMDPVVYDFRINQLGTFAELLRGQKAVMGGPYMDLMVPKVLAETRVTGRPVEAQRRVEFNLFAAQPEAATGNGVSNNQVFRSMTASVFPGEHISGLGRPPEWDLQAREIMDRFGFDPIQHAKNRDDLLRGRIGLVRNRLPINLDIRDLEPEDWLDASTGSLGADSGLGTDSGLGREIITKGGVGVVSLAGGVGSRWTMGAGVVKAVNPFVGIGGRHRSFLEVHLAKTAKTQSDFGAIIPHAVTTSYLTHSAIEAHLPEVGDLLKEVDVRLSPGQSIAHRLIPTRRDLMFLWEESAQAKLDDNKQKVREASRRAIMDWCQSTGEATDYVDNIPLQRFHPPGHFYEVPNLILSGTLAEMLATNPSLQWLMVHNIDCLGATVCPMVLEKVEASGATIAFEVIPKRVEDHGGGLGRVAGRPRIIEGLAQPDDATEFRLGLYNSLTTWVHIDRFLAYLGLDRKAVLAGDRVILAKAIRQLAARIPTYVTIKDVKRRWGLGQEDIFPVVQLEKLWGDLSNLDDLTSAYLRVDRSRGQQLKDPAQLDGWARDGSLAHIQRICGW